MITKIIEDIRKIKSLSKEEWYVKVGEDGITKIIPYLENGNVIWFAIYKGDEIYQRVDAIGLLVTYEISRGE